MIDKKINSAKRWLGLLIAILVAMMLFTFTSCTTTKKSFKKEIHKSDSSIVENNYQILATETAHKSDMITNEATTTESGYEVIAVDSGKNVVVSDGSEYFTVETKKPTKFILPKKSEKKATTTIDKSTTNKIEASERIEEKKVDVKKADVVIDKQVKRTGISFWGWLIAAIVGTIWYLNKKYKLYDRVKAFILTIIPI